jgi:glycosyltransferase involved in cell wall biosynthesis
MKVLIIHNDSLYFAGAEKMLAYYLEGLPAASCEPMLAVVRGSRVSDAIPPLVRRLWIPEKQRFSIRKLFRQVRRILEARRDFAFDLVHGWTARDWELTSIVAALARRPAIGTLHDHPRAKAISSYRQFLMRTCARRGLDKVVCVSQAVSIECARADYPPKKLAVIQNGLPSFGELSNRPPNQVCRLGFLGVYSERKGLHDLFLMLDELSRLTSTPWQASIAGAAQDPTGEKLVASIHQRFSQKPWWPQVEWHGWVQNPVQFLKTLDLLIVPSSEFDPFPTVLLEAGGVGLPVLAAKVGGVEEIVLDTQTGWLFENGDWKQAAEILRRLLPEPNQLKMAGAEAFRRVGQEFTIRKMVDNYLEVYSTLAANV